MRHSSSRITGGNCNKSPINNTCTPPNGLFFLRTVCIIKSIASSKSARNILTSSMISNSILRITDFFKPLILKWRRRVALVSNLALSEKSGAELSGINPPKGS